MDVVKRVCLVLAFAGMGILSVDAALPKESHWRGESQLENSSPERKTWLWALPVSSQQLTVGIKTRNLHAEPYRKYGRKKADEFSPAQGVCVVSARGDTLLATLMLRRRQTPLDYDDEMMARIYRSKLGNIIFDETVSLSKGLFAAISNDMSIRVSFGNRLVTVEAGNRDMQTVAEYPDAGFVADSVGFVLEPGAKVDKVSGSALSYNPPFDADECIADVEKLREYIDTSDDSLEGEWEYMDRQMDESLLKPGGEYRLLILKDTDDVYNIFYVDGARVNPRQWQPGMIKGRLKVMSPDRYDLQWRDSEGEWMQHGLKAAMEDEGILTLLFPYQASTVRLRRIR